MVNMGAIGAPLRRATLLVQGIAFLKPFRFQEQAAYADTQPWEIDATSCVDVVQCEVDAFLEALHVAT